MTATAVGSRSLRGRLAVVRGVLFDRDDTLILDSPRHNGDPLRVTPVPGARNAVTRLRAAGYRVGMISSRSASVRGMLTVDQTETVNRRVAQLVGRMDTWRYCPHTPLEECLCRRPGPQLVLQAARDLSLLPQHVALVGDIGSDMHAAQAAGAVGILVPSPRTLKADIREASVVAATIGEAVELVLSAARPRVASR